MQQLITYLREHPAVLYWTCAILVVPALFINLGLTAIWMDEPTRALVAMEMMISENFVTPTLMGEYYYNKPPLYNWMLIGLFDLFGENNEFVLRIPAAFFLMVYGITIFLTIRKYLNWKIAFMTALMLITCGRMLIFSSYIGHIDIFYSWLTYMSFIAIYEFYQREQYLLLFTVSYFLASLGFMCKALPSIVFQGGTLLAFFVYNKDFKRLLSWQHIVGGLLFLSIVSLYFFVYSQYNSLETYFQTLWFESSRRTVIEKSFLESIAHLFTFPFATIYHLLPWTLFVVFCFKKGFFKELLANSFLKFCVWIFLANVLVYWASPDTRPRYLFMLYPLLFCVLAYAYESAKEDKRQWVNIFYYLTGSLAIVLGLGVWVVPFVEVLADLSLVWGKVALVSGIILGAGFLLFRLKTHRFVLLAICMLGIRLGYDFFVFPHRQLTGTFDKWKQNALDIAEIAEGEELYVYPTFEFNQELIYYITRERNEILRGKTEILPNTFYLCTDTILQDMPHKLYYDFIERRYMTHVNLVKFTASDKQDP
ncbi:MAG: glycosyltransferase family 39 protein [Bacteroidota bacterium]